MKNKLLLFIIIILGFGLRLFKLSQNPPGLNHNEVAIGYNAYSLIETNKDQQGNFMPLFFNLYNQKRLPGYIYLTMIPVRFLGTTAVSVRLIAVLSGLGLVLTSYLITKQITNNEKISLFSALLAAISPWSLFLSRFSLSTNLTALFISFGIYFWLAKKKWLSFLFWGISLYTHISAWFVFPFFILYSLIILIKKKKWLSLIIGLLITLLFIGPIAYHLFYLNQISQFSLINPDAAFISTYLKNIDLRTIFFNRGDLYFFSTPGHGLLFLTTAPFLIAGLFALIKNHRWLLLIWLLTSFVPASLWFKQPSLSTSLILLPLPMIIIGAGLNYIIEFLKKKSKFGGNLVLLVLTIAVLVEFGFWWRDYWKIYRNNYSWAWQYGYDQVVDYVKQNYSQYDQIFITKKHGYPKQHLLFHWPWNPEYHHQGDQENFDKFEFVYSHELAERVVESEAERKLVITSGGNYSSEAQLVKQVKYLNGEIAFELVEY